MTKSDDPFLERWSRRKRDARETEATPDPGAAPDPRAAGDGDPATAEVPAISEADLPDVETLEESSDFTVFLQEGVPEALRRKALRRLWRLNPIFANLDGLNDYDEDYTDAATVVAGLKSLYQVGRGMVPEDEDPDADAEVAADAAPTVDSAAAATSETEPENEPDPDPAPPRAPPGARAALSERATVRPGAARRRRDPLARRWGQTRS